MFVSMRPGARTILCSFAHLCVARTADGRPRRGPGKPGHDAQMMSEFGKDPNADLMDSTAGAADLCIVLLCTVVSVIGLYF